MIVRDRRLGDTAALLGILRRSYPVWYRRIPYLFTHTIVVEAEGRVVGFVAVPVGGRSAEVGLIAVDKGYRYRGVGARLLEAALEYARSRGVGRCWARARPDNQGGIALFTSRGFSNSGLRRRRLLGDVYILERDVQ